MKKKDKKNENKKEDLEKKIEDLDDQLKRSVADFQNLQKRFDEERKQLIRYANHELLQKLVPALDTLFLAEKYVKDEGLKLTIKNVSNVLESVGVERIKTEGTDFDANKMECTETVQGEEGKVIEEVRPGFLYNDKLLQPAHVKVGQK